MPSYSVDPDDYLLSQLEKRQNIWGTGSAGMTAGMAAGSVAGPWGTAIGGVVGGATGLIVGGVQNKRSQEELDMAMKRDQELADQLNNVDHMNMMMEAVGARTQGQEQNAEIGARTAAARGGLSTASAEGIAQKGRHNAAMERSVAVSQAIPMAAQADMQERNQILNEEVTRQNLFDAATGNNELIGAFGKVAGAAVATSQVVSAAKDVIPPRSNTPSATVNGRAVSNTTGREARQANKSAEMDAAAAQASATGASSQLAAELGRPPEAADFLGGDGTKQGEAVNETSKKLFGKDGATDQQKARQSSSLLRTQQSYYKENSVASDWREADAASQAIGIDLKNGVVSDEEFQMILRRNPKAAVDTDEWNLEKTKLKNEMNAQDGLMNLSVQSY